MTVLVKPTGVVVTINGPEFTIVDPSHSWRVLLIIIGRSVLSTRKYSCVNHIEKHMTPPVTQIGADIWSSIIICSQSLDILATDHVGDWQLPDLYIPSIIFLLKSIGTGVGVGRPPGANPA